MALTRLSGRVSEELNQDIETMVPRLRTQTSLRKLSKEGLLRAILGHALTLPLVEIERIVRKADDADL